MCDIGHNACDTDGLGNGLNCTVNWGPGRQQGSCLVISVPFAPEVFAISLLCWLSLAARIQSVPLNPRGLSQNISEQTNKTAGYYLLFVHRLVEMKLNRSPLVEQIQGMMRGCLAPFAVGRKLLPLSSTRQTTSLHKWPVLVYAGQTKN